MVGSASLFKRNAATHHFRSATLENFEEQSRCYFNGSPYLAAEADRLLKDDCKWTAKSLRFTGYENIHVFIKASSLVLQTLKHVPATEHARHADKIKRLTCCSALESIRQAILNTGRLFVPFVVAAATLLGLSYTTASRDYREWRDEQKSIQSGAFL